MEKSIFKNKNYILALLGAIVSNTGSIFYNFVVSFYILDLTNNNAFIQGTYLAMCGIVLCLFILFGGVIADRFNKAKIMYLCDYIKGALILLTALSIIFFKNNTASLVLLFVCGALSNIIAAIFSPASSSIYPVIVEEEMLQQANSYSNAFLTFQGIIGGILAAILYGLLEPTTIFIIVGVLYILSGVSEMFIKYEMNNINDEKLTLKSSFKDIKEGMNYVINVKSVFYMTLIILLINFFFSPVCNNCLPYLIKTDISTHSYFLDNIIKPETWETIFSISLSISSIIFALVVSKRDSNKPVKKLIRFTLSGIAFVSFLLSLSYYIFVKKDVNFNAFLISSTILMFILGALLSLTNIPFNTKLQMIIDKDKLGKVDSILNIGSQGLIPLSSFLAGIILESFGVFVLVLSCSIGILIPVTFLFTVKQIKEL